MTSSVVLLLADTARSQAYAQALLAADVPVAAALVVQSPERRRWGQASTAPAFAGNSDLPIPDLSIPLLDTVTALTNSVTVSDQGTLNGSDVLDWRAGTTGLTVFSGFGGEIVAASVIDAGGPMLHLHSGDLPDYRGSTTMYYSLLNGLGCVVTAILLDEDIDTGPIVGKASFAPPPAGMDLDYLYDPAIRAATLIEVLEEWRANDGSFPNMQPQPADGTTYYIIHPVLKHIAMLNLADRPE